LGCGGLATALCFLVYTAKNICFKQKSNVLYSVGNSPHKKYDSLKMAAVP
tara:strand:+ start:5879 stop:6028 length:150 start_codon:yes stop_codon:yes gene_type:complete